MRFKSTIRPADGTRHLSHNDTRNTIPEPTVEWCSESMFRFSVAFGTEKTGTIAAAKLADVSEWSYIFNHGDLEYGE